MHNLIKQTTTQFPELDLCQIVDLSQPLKTRVNETIVESGAKKWLDWMSTTKQQLNYSRIHLTNGKQLFAKKLESTKYLFVLNERENTTFLINYILGLDTDGLIANNQTTLPTVANTKDISDPKILEAVRIQNMIIPKEDMIRQSFKNFFVYHQQQDLVGGDFYWHYKQGAKVYFAVIDCTGHSLEGAMTSMVVNTLLNQIIPSLNSDSPKDILQKFYAELNEYNNNTSTGSNYGIGAEIGLFYFDFDRNTMKFSSSGIPAFIKYDSHIALLKAKKVLDYNNLTNLLSDSILDMQEIRGIYSFTDGITDQFDSSDKKKLGRKGVLQMIEGEENFDANYYLSAINKWKGDNIQYDDITLVGIAI